jgi:hypothetical protein
MSPKPVLDKPFLFTALQVGLGVVLLALSTHLAIESKTYLEVLNQSGLNQYHAFALLVCVSFFAGIFLIAQPALKENVRGFDEFSPY